MSMNHLMVSLTGVCDCAEDKRVGRDGRDERRGGPLGASQVRHLLALPVRPPARQPARPPARPVLKLRAAWCVLVLKLRAACCVLQQDAAYMLVDDPVVVRPGTVAPRPGQRTARLAACSPS